MKVLEGRSNIAQISQVFEKVLKQDMEICLWQKSSDYTTNRIQYCFSLSTFTKNPSMLNFSQVVEKKIDFKMGKCFCYCASLGFICTAGIIAFGKTKISLELPTMLILLNEDEKKLVESNNWVELTKIFKKAKTKKIDDISNVKRSLSEDERYKNVREAPRGKARENILVKIAKKIKHQTEIREFLLLDLSKGGLAITVKNPNYFQVGDSV